MTFTLDQDEREVLGCLIENSIIKEKIVKYARGHGHDLRGKPFEYDKATGEVYYVPTPDAHLGANSK